MNYVNRIYQLPVGSWFSLKEKPLDIKLKLQAEFPQVNDAFFEKEKSHLFLRVEVAYTTMDEVANLSRKISDFLDANDPGESNYILDVYSAGTEQKLKLEEIGKAVDKKIRVKLKRMIKNKIEFEGKLLSAGEGKLLVNWNAKGQMRKQEILFEDIEAITLVDEV